MSRGLYTAVGLKEAITPQEAKYNKTAYNSYQHIHEPVYF